MANYRCQYTDSTAQLGFTLVELMVTIAIMGIIASIAVPSFQRQMAQQRQLDTASSIIAVLKQAKAEARIRNQNITVSYASNVITATDAGSSSLVRQKINSASSVVGSASSVIIQPSATSTAATYDVCDTKFRGEDKLRVAISATGQISSQSLGVCS